MFSSFFFFSWACMMFSRLKTGRWLSRLPDILRSFSKPLYHRESHSPAFCSWLFSCLVFASTVDFCPSRQKLVHLAVDFCPSTQKLVHLAVNIFEEHHPPWENSKLGETKALCVSSSENPQTNQNKQDSLGTRCCLLSPVPCIHTGDSSCRLEDPHRAGE